jgi:hypothetical protein
MASGLQDLTSFWNQGLEELQSAVLSSGPEVEAPEAPSAPEPIEAPQGPAMPEMDFDR